MGLVILAAFCVAAFAITFRFFERYQVPLFPAITVNYFIACCCGLLFYPPWGVGDVRLLWMPALMLGILFVTIFSLTGISARKAGAARTTIAGRMSLVITVLATVRVFREHLAPLAWAGIGLALVGLVLSTASAHGDRQKRSWLLPTVIFLGSGAADVIVNAAQRVRTTSLNETAFTTLCFASASAVSLCVLLVRGGAPRLCERRVWIGGAVLGVVNYASLLFLIMALGAGSMAASTIFPLMNIMAILFASVAGVLVFKEHLSPRQWTGMMLCITALALIMLA